MSKLPSGVDINNLIDDIRIFSWQAADILLYYSKLLEDTDGKKKILENNNEDEFRDFSSAETDGNIMFTFDAANSDVSSTAKTLNSLHAQHREYDEQLKRELASTKGLFEVAGHDLLFSQADSTQAGSGAGKVPDSK